MKKNPPNLLTTTNPHDAPMQASKWLKCPLLLSANEMSHLIVSLKPLYFYVTGSLTPQGHSEIPIHSFLAGYEEYVSLLSKGQLPDEAKYRTLFSSVMTNSLDTLFALIVDGDKQLIRLSKPVIQLQPHRLHYSEADKSFRSMTYGTDGILWGIQFSYPQLCQDGRSQEIRQVDLSPEFPNTQLFRNLQKRTRDHTIPTPFLVGDQKINLPARLGKECLSWINQHPQLIQKGIRVAF